MNRLPGVLRPLPVIALFVLTGCGDGAPGPGAKQCTFSGGLTGHLPCREDTAVWTSSTATSVLRVLSTTVTNPVLSIQFGFNGEPSSGHYVGDKGGVTCDITLYDPGVQSRWYATTLPTERNGSCELTITSVRKETDDGATRSYEVHGTFLASLAAGDNAVGTTSLLGGF